MKQSVSSMKGCGPCRSSSRSGIFVIPGDPPLMLKAHLSRRQTEMLLLIAEHQPVTYRFLARKMGCVVNNITGLLSHLVEKGYVENEFWGARTIRLVKPLEWVEVNGDA